MKLLKKELSRILEELSEDTYVNIISFTRKPDPWKKALHSVKGRGREEAIRFVQEMPLGFGTNIYDSLELALMDKRVNTIFLLSDGAPVSGKYTRPEDIRREIGAINRVRGARIHCISIGGSEEEVSFLKELAKENQGEYRAAKSSAN